jgi:hypothetical protein
MNSGLREQDEAGEMESGVVVRTNSRNTFWQLNRLRQPPRGCYSCIPRCQSVHKAVL